MGSAGEARKVLKRAGWASEPAGRASDGAGWASEPAVGPRGQLGGPQNQLGGALFSRGPNLLPTALEGGMGKDDR